MIVSVVLNSCFSKNYKIITDVGRDGSCIRTISTSDSVYPYEVTPDWNILTYDTIVTNSHSTKTEEYVRISKKFNSVNELSIGLKTDKIFPTPKESLKKCFRWFYTYYTFTAVYPEITDKGNVPMDKYLNETERRLYLQGDMSGYSGMTGMELKEELGDIETSFMKWYTRSVYDMYFDVIEYFAENDQSRLSSIKDSLFVINEEQLGKQLGPTMEEICNMLDEYFATDHFSKLYAENKQEMENMSEKKMKVIDELMNFNIQYELTLPGKLITANTTLYHNNVLSWKVDAFRFLADDYILTAESRAVNIWAFVVTLLLIVFAVYCFRKYF